MNYTQAIDQVRDVVVKMRYLESIDNIIYCDKWHVCPKDGFSYEADVNAYLAEVRHDQLVNDNVAQLVAYFETADDSQYQNDIERGMVNYLTAKYKEAVQIPAQLQARLNKACSEGQLEWERCVHANDYESFKPVLKEAFDVQREIAQAIDPAKPVYQVLVNRFDKDFTLEEIDAIFEKLKEAIRDILAKTEESRAKIDTSVLKNDADKQTMMELVREVQDLLGFDWNKGVMYEVHHPVCTCNGPRDSRPSTNYYELFRSQLAAAHETGHGLYNYNGSDEVAAAGLWGGIDGAMHESQSKFYENMVGRTKEFWTAFYPKLQEKIPKYRDVKLDDLLCALNKPIPGTNRLNADELTVDLHIILRYELERDYFEGKISVDTMDQAWNAKYKEYLGVEPKTYSEGVLQDVHWASGYIGYFQGYTLGEIYAAQMRHKMLEDCPDAYEKLAQGDISVINQWLKEHVHQYGQTYSARQTLIKATGEDVNIQYYIDYLRDKFLR